MRNKEYRDEFARAHTFNLIAAQIHKLRKAAKLSQAELAKRSDMNQSRISMLEDPELENIELDTLQRIASALDVAVSVRFVPFSEIVAQAADFAAQKLDVTSFDSDTIERQAVSEFREVVKPATASRKIWHGTYSYASTNFIEKFEIHSGYGRATRFSAPIRQERVISLNAQGGSANDATIVH
ncbi:helix-turn-helix domain-containing protein [Labrys neptuniae]